MGLYEEAQVQVHIAPPNSLVRNAETETKQEIQIRSRVPRLSYVCPSTMYSTIQLSQVLTYAKRKARPRRAPAPAVILLRVIAEAAPVGVDDEEAVVWETVTVAKVADEEAAAVVVVALLSLDEEAPAEDIVSYCCERIDR